VAGNLTRSLDPGDSFQGYGGGMMLTGCRVRIEAGGLFGGVIFNQARFGAGIYATGGSTVELVGDEDHPAEVAGNQAHYFGGGSGGIHATGKGTTVRARNASIRDNVGGGVAVWLRASLNIDRTPMCHTFDRCSTVSGNTGFGIDARENAFATVLQTYIEGNAGPAVQAVSSVLQMESVVMAGNYLSGQPLVQVIPGQVVAPALPDAVLSHITIADNTESEIPLLQVSGDVRIRNSILWQSRGPLFSGTRKGVSLRCALVSERDSLPDDSAEVFDSLPGFAGPGDYHLGAESAAIDRCMGPETQIGDIDGDPRPVNVPGSDDASSPFDIGADEASFGSIPGTDDKY
jgi:hypothetical protein